MKLSILQGLALLLIVNNAVVPCSTIGYQKNGNSYLARNYDFNFGHGMLVTNKRNIRKASLISQAEYMKLSAEWTSKYGSVTFNQFSRELPTGGMNEKGLAVELMWLVGSRAGKPDSRKAVNELQWIQYQLDNYETVRQMKENAGRIQIISTAAPLHYMACDRQGECGVFEFHKNRVKVYSGKDLPLRISTNHFYKEDIFPNNKTLDYQEEETATILDSKRRFSVLSDYLGQHQIKDPVAYGFSGLDKVKGHLNLFQRLYYFFKGQNPATHWQIVYSMKTGEIYFRTHASGEIKKVAIGHFDYSCKTPVRTLDIDYERGGNANDAFHVYHRNDNKRIVDLSFGKWDALPKSGKKFLVDFPEKLKCTERE